MNWPILPLTIDAMRILSSEQVSRRLHHAAAGHFQGFRNSLCVCVRNICPDGFCSTRKNIYQNGRNSAPKTIRIRDGIAGINISPV